MRTAIVLALAALLAAPSLATARDDDSRPSRGSRGNGGGNRGGNGNGNGHGNGGGNGHAGGNGNGWGWGRNRGGAPAPSPAPAPGSGRGGYVPAPAPGRSAYGGPAPWYPARTATTYRYPSSPAPAPTYGYSQPAAVRPYWGWGWSWGPGYYPLYPRPASTYVPPEGVELVRTRLSGGVAAMRDGAASGISLAIEGPTVGFEVGIDGIAISGVTGDVALGSSSAIGWGTTHLTWAVVSDDVLRIRVEAGASMLSMPAGGASAGAPWAGRIGFGPDVGVSGNLGLLGPIGIEGHARITPVPVPVTDVRLALAMRGGPLAVTAGWRSIHVAGDGVDAPALRFSGPELGLALLF